MKTPKIIHHQQSVIALRKDLYAPLEELTRYVLSQFSATNLCHTLEIPTNVPGIVQISEYLTDADWQEEYWEKYYNKNPVSKVANEQLNVRESYYIACDEVDPNSECMEARKEACNIRSSFAIVKQLSNGIKENTAITFDRDVSFSELEMVKFWNYIHLIREAHFSSLDDPLVLSELEGYLNRLNSN